MLTEQKFQSLKTIIQESSRDEIIWMSGYLAGLSEKNLIGATPPLQVENAEPTEKLTISVLYGTETGNSKKIATKLASVLKGKPCAYYNEYTWRWRTTCSRTEIL